MNEIKLVFHNPKQREIRGCRPSCAAANIFDSSPRGFSGGVRDGAGPVFRLRQYRFCLLRSPEVFLKFGHSLYLSCT